jgi:hypothetical protein
LKKTAAEEDWVMPYDLPVLLRFLAKWVLDVLPAALASVIGGFLVTHYQAARAVAPAPAAEQAAPASAQMLRLVRDEHALIVDFLNAQLAAEKQRLADEEEARRAAADSKPAIAAAPPRRLAVATIAAKPVAPRTQPLDAVAVPQAPLVIAQAELSESLEPAVRAPPTLLARTIDIKDHVVAATQRVVSVIGDAASSTGRMVGASW